MAGARVDKLRGLTFVGFAREREAAKVHLLVLTDADAPAVGIAGRIERQHHPTATHDERTMDAPAVLEHIRDAVHGEPTDDRPEIDGRPRLHSREFGTLELKLGSAKIIIGFIPIGVIRVERRRPARVPIAE